MNVKVEMEGETGYYGDISATGFKVFVIVDDEKLPLLEFEGYEGDGCYGRGFWLYTYPLEKWRPHKAHACNRPETRGTSGRRRSWDGIEMPPSARR